MFLLAFRNGRGGYNSRAPKSRGVKADGGGGGPTITTHYRVCIILYGSDARCTRTAVIVRRRETDRGRSISHWSSWQLVVVVVVRSGGGGGGVGGGVVVAVGGLSAGPARRYTQHLVGGGRAGASSGRRVVSYPLGRRRTHSELQDTDAIRARHIIIRRYYKVPARTTTLSDYYYYYRVIRAPRLRASFSYVLYYSRRSRKELMELGI